MTSSRRFDRLLQAGCLGLIGMLTAVGCGGSSGTSKKDAGTDGGPVIPDGSILGSANLTVSSPSIDFGTVDVGTTSAPSNITVTNAGPGKSGALTVEVTGAGLKVSGCNGTVLEAAKTCVIAVTVTPGAVGPISGTVKVYDTADKAKSVNVTGSATMPGQFSLTPSSLDLGPVLAGKQATGTIVLTNISTAGLTGLSVTVSGPGYTAGAGGCSDALGVGQSCNIIVNFTAGATSGVAKGAVTVNQAGATKTANVTATVQTPAKLVMTPPSAAFQTVVGAASSAVTFYVTNSGDVASAAPTVTLAGANKDDFSMTTTCAVALQPAAVLPTGCQVVVVYNPKLVPATTSVATLTVAEAGANGTSAKSELTGTAVAKSSLTITGTATDMGTVVVGSAGAVFTFTVTNNGGDDSGAVKVSSTAAQFVVVADNCTDKSLPAKASCTFTAQFKPVAGDLPVVQGSFKASGANVQNPAFLGVTGNAVPQAALVADPKVLEFHTVPFNQESSALTLTISNSGGASTGPLKVDNTGAQFSLKNDNCSNAVLTATGATKSCTILVTFTPTGLTSVDSTGNIIVTDTTGAAGSATASLHGTGVKRPDVAISPVNVCAQSGDTSCSPSPESAPDFADTVVGKTSTTIPFTITNSTDPSVAADSGTIAFAFSGDAAADFAIVNNNCTAPLVSAATPQTCVVTVSFTPSAVGLRKAFLTLTTSRGSVDKATLEGLGVSALELVPMDADLPDVTGLDLGSTPIGKPGSSMTYRVWVRDTTAADHTTTVTVALPTPSQPDFVFAGSNDCTNKTLDLSSTLTLQNSYHKAGSFWYCEFDVQFAPKSAKGALTADLTASATGGGSSKLTLTGTSTGPLVVGFGPTQTKPVIISEPVAVGMYAEKTVTIANQGTTTVTGLTFGLSGTGSGDFQIVSTTCWGDNGDDHHARADIKAVNLLSGGSCTVTVRFAPSTEAKYSVVFTASATNGTIGTETDTVAIIANSASTFGALSITPSIANTQFGDVPEDSTTAPAVTFTVTNTGSLPAKELHITGLTEFALLPSAGTAGACAFEDANLVLAKNAPCTFSVRPTPGTKSGLGTGKVAVSRTMSVSTVFGLQTVAVDVPVLYYVTSSIVVKDTGASSTALTYAFPAAGVNTNQSHNFVVTNLGSAAATLVTSVAAPYSVAQAPTGTFDPPACVYTAGGLAAGASCTLVLQNLNTVSSSDAETLLTLQDGTKYGRATVTLTKKTLGDSQIVLKFLDSAPTIDLGSVPADSTTASFVGGKATVWFQNTGEIPTAALSFKWDATGAGTADKEFIIDSDETSCVGKVLQPGALCSMNIHFKYDSVLVPALGLRTRVLKVMDGAKEPLAASLVTFTATATATASLRIEDPIDPIKTGFYQFAGSTLRNVASAARTFRIVNTTGATQTFTLPTLVDGEDDFIYASTQPANGCKVDATATVLDTTTSACSFNVVFKPNSDSPFYKHASITVTDAHGAGASDDVTATLGLMGKVQQPVTLAITPTSTSGARVDFGTIGAGASVAKSFTITNTGDVAMATDKASLSTVLAATPAGATYAITADNCNASRLAAGASCVVTVTVTGVSFSSAQNDSITVGSTDYTTLTGYMTAAAKDAAAIAVSPTTGGFGQVPVTGTSEIVFTVSNATNGVTSGAVAATLTGKDAAQFAISSSTCTAAGLAGGANCLVTVAFKPTALAADANDLAAVLNLTATPGGTKTVNLTGKPVPALSILVGDAAVTSVDLSSSALQVFTVLLADTATATTALKTSLVGPDFMIVNDSCYASILSPGNQVCYVAVKYVGTASATKKSATLTVNGGSTPKTASVVVNITNIQAEAH